MEKLDLFFIEDVSFTGRSGVKYEFTVLYHWDGKLLTPVAVLSGIRDLVDYDRRMGTSKMTMDAQDIGGFNLDPEDYCYPIMYYANQSYRQWGCKDVSVGVYTLRQFAICKGWDMARGGYYVVPGVLSCDVPHFSFEKAPMSVITIPEHFDFKSN